DLPDRARAAELQDVDPAVQDLAVDRVQEPAHDALSASLVAGAGALEVEEDEVLSGVAERTRHAVAGRVSFRPAEDEGAAAVAPGQGVRGVEDEAERRAVGGERAQRTSGFRRLDDP